MTTLDRAFVPLAAVPHSWFADGLKTWELRRRRRGLGPGTIREGRRVELRRGYQDRSSSLWGTIREVKIAPSVEAFFGEVPFGQVIPPAISHDDAVERAAAILGIDSQGVEVVGFRVELDPADAVTDLPAADEYRAAILDGTKKATVRRGHREFLVGPGRFVFRHSEPIPILIQRIVHLTVADLDDKAARSDGFTDLEELLAALRTHYPDLSDADPATLVYLERLER